MSGTKVSRRLASESGERNTNLAYIFTPHYSSVQRNGLRVLDKIPGLLDHLHGFPRDEWHYYSVLEQDKGLLDRALEGLDQNVSAMGMASKGMKTLQRMNEEQGFWGRLKLQLLIAGMWLVAILLVFVAPKLRF